MSEPKRIYSPIRYAGGKTKAAKLIAPHVPSGVKRIISPFIGGASFELYMATIRPDIEVVGYDIFQPLVEFWNLVLKSPKELSDAVAEYKPTKTCFTETREELKEWWEQHKDIVKRGDKILFENDIKRLKFVAMYYYNHQYSYGPMFLGWPSSVYLKAKVHKQIIARLRDFKCPNLKVKWGDFQQVMSKHSDDFVYADPPYYERMDEDADSGKKNELFKPLYPNCNFPIHHRGFDHDALRDLLKSHKGGFILSYNNCPTIREWYKEFRFEYPTWHYSYSQGEKRIGVNREVKVGVVEKKMTEEQKQQAQKKESHEVLVINTSPSAPLMNAISSGLFAGTDTF